MLNFPFIFIIPDKCETRHVGNCARVTPRSRRSTFTFLKKGRGESHPLLFHPLPLRLADDSCESAMERFTQLPQRRWNDAQVRGRKRCRYHCSNCGLYCLERNVASSNYPPVLLLEPRWVITVNGSVFVLLKDYTCVYVCEIRECTLRGGCNQRRGEDGRVDASVYLAFCLASEGGKGSYCWVAIVLDVVHIGAYLVFIFLKRIERDNGVIVLIIFV